MSMSVFSYSILGVRIEYMDFHITKDLGIQCPNGHEPDKKEPLPNFCAECGGKFESRQKDVPNERLLALCEFLGSDLDSTKKYSNDAWYWVREDNSKDNVRIHNIEHGVMPGNERYVIGYQLSSISIYGSMFGSINLEKLSEKKEKLQKVLNLLKLNDRPIELYLSLKVN
jgi:hypothetical protein